MRQINRIVVHHSATPMDARVDAAVIDGWHRERGWSGIGYHLVIQRNGMIEHGRPIDQVGAHAKGHNVGSVGICLIGNGVEYAFTAWQYEALRHALHTLLGLFPGCEICGHRDLAATQCPGFDVRAWWIMVNREVT